MSVIRRFADSISYYFKGLYRLFRAEKVFVWCAAIAFKTLIAVVPISILIFGIFGQVINQADIFRTLQSMFESLMPGSVSAQMIDALTGIAGVRNTLTVIGSIGFFVTSITLFSTLRVVIGLVFAERHNSRDPFRAYASDIRMAIFLGALFLVTLGLTFGIGFINRLGLDLFSQDSSIGELLRETWVGLIYSIRYIFPFLTTFALFFLLYYFIPKPRPKASSAALGALVTSVLWELAKLIFSLYASRLADFEKYGNIVTGALGDVLSVIIVLLFWVYYAGLVLVIGASVAYLREVRVRPAVSEAEIS